MSEFRFAEPQWVHALWGVFAFAVALFFLERRAASRFDALVAAPLQRRLVVGPTTGQRHARNGALVLACVFAVLGLMRPQWGFEFVESPQVSAELMIAIDVSRSMLAEDVAPNRLERAKSEIRDLLEFLTGDQVGLIAFAGRASVLAPMTPDFGFFRLVLDSLGPNSVGRGGTRLEEPIRKAIAGFRATGDIARVLLLITDGEDHDSFPIEAAKEAAERGIRIVAIGFGSESGSEIPITDRETGARTLLRDSNGDIVKTRLDGDTLREMALLTEGVYVPAGLGALDLESIYDSHIKSLMRGKIDSEGRVVRSEGFQWFVLASIVCLFASVLIGQRRSRQMGEAAKALALVAALLVVAPEGTAQTPQASGAVTPSGAAIALAEGEAVAGVDALETAAPIKEEPVGDPRENYNAALDALAASRVDEAKQYFEQARAGAATDGEARYRATYGLGSVAVAEADTQLESAPEEALNALYRAGDFFREAVRLQPANEDPRYNLEIVLQRARVLADSIAKRDEKDLAAKLDELIGRQRTAASDARGLLEKIDFADQGAQLDDSFRAEFRALSTRQRQLLSDGDRFAERVARERDGLEATPDEERSPEDSVRVVQLQQLEVYLQRGRERMGHSRRELRGQRGERAYRRANAALAELKRARDQLRDPVELLDAILRDEIELARYTQAMAMAAAPGSNLSGGITAQSTPQIPSWLSLPALLESQQSIGERTRELDERLQAGVAYAEQAELQPPPQPTSEEEAAELAQQQKTLEQVVDAAPFVATAAQALHQAAASLDMEETQRAAELQVEGMKALAEARERFLDLRRLIEVSLADQSRLQGVFKAASSEEGQVPAAQLLEMLPALRDAQLRNISRAGRLAELITDELAALPPEEAIASLADAEAEAAKNERETFTLAEQILLVTETSMQGVDVGLATTDAIAWGLVSVAGGQAERGLENLRRLFFSIIEHLRETAARQEELGDETEEVAALDDDNRARGLGPLLPRQAELAEISGVIANVLEEQSRQEPGDLVGGGAGGTGGPGGDEEAMAEQAANLRRAAELTLEAQIDMEDTGEKLEAAPANFAAARELQGQALERLLEALELLTPPQEQQKNEQQQDEQDQEQGDDQQQEQQEQGEQGQQPAQPESVEEQQETDPSQLLQEVRDREAARRREEAERQQGGFNTVERDW